MATPANFDRVVEQSGFGFACVLYYEQLEDEFWNSLDYGQWPEIAKNAKYKLPELYRKAIEAMISTARTTAELGFVFKELESDSPLRETVISQMIAKALTFDDWCLVYQHSTKGVDDNVLAYANMTQTAETYDNWLIVFRVTRPGATNEAAVFDKVLSLVDSWGSSLGLYHSCEHGIFARPALSRVADFATSKEACVYVYKRSVEHVTVREKILRVLRAADFSINGWLHICNECEGDAHVIAMEKLEAKTASFDDWCECIHNAISRTPAHRLCSRKMLALATSFKQLQSVYEFSESEEIDQAVLQKAQEVLTTFDDWQVAMYEIDSEETSLEELVISKLIELAPHYHELQTVASHFGWSEYSTPLLLPRFRELAPSLGRASHEDLPAQPGEE